MPREEQIKRIVERDGEMERIVEKNVFTLKVCAGESFSVKA